MASTYAPQKDSRGARESAGDRFQRLRREAKEDRPEAVGSPTEIARETAATLRTWSKTRRRANKTA